MRIVITRNLLRPLLAIAFVLLSAVLIVNLGQYPRTEIAFLFGLALAGLVNAVCLELGVVAPGRWTGWSATALAFQSTGLLLWAVSRLLQLENAADMAGLCSTIGTLLFVAGMLLAGRRQQQRARGGS